MSVGILVDVGQSLTKFTSELVSIDLDVTNDEIHEWTNEVTTNPVEIGTPISDHIQELPDKVRITGMISDSAISDNVIRQFSNIDDSQFLTRSQTTFDLLRNLIKDKKLVTVYTRYKTYTDMALVSINLPRNNTTGDAINFTAEFMHVRVVSTQSVDIPKGISKKKTAKVDKATQQKTEPTSKGGDKSTKPVENVKIDESLAKAVAAGAKKLALSIGGR